MPLTEGATSVILAKTALTIAQIAFVIVGVALFMIRHESGLAMIPTLAALALAGIGVAAVLVLLQRRGLVAFVARLIRRVMPRARLAARLATRAPEIDERLRAFYGARPRAAAASVAFHFVGWVTGVLVILAALDYAWQRRQHQQSLRMSRSEVKDEARQSEGDPKIKARLKRAYQEIVKTRSLADVPTADVVITNPIHLAVALKYEPGGMGAPRVVAKGAEGFAQRIKDLARQHGVPIMERRSLARALFRSVPVGQEIPATLYRAIAEVLAYVYGFMGRVLAGGELVIPLTFVVVVIVMIIPLPTVLLDLLLTVNIAVSLIILLVAMYTLKPLEFSTFPSVLLVTTLLRLSLNVASTRLILLHGHEGAAAAGHVIQAFGLFVVGGSYVVGVVIFLILVVINFIVVTHILYRAFHGRPYSKRLVYPLVLFSIPMAVSIHTVTAFLYNGLVARRDRAAGVWVASGIDPRFPLSAVVCKACR